MRIYLASTADDKAIKVTTTYGEAAWDPSNRDRGQDLAQSKIIRKSLAQYRIRLGYSQGAYVTQRFKVDWVPSLCRGWKIGAIWLDENL